MACSSSARDRMVFPGTHQSDSRLLLWGRSGASCGRAFPAASKSRLTPFPQKANDSVFRNPTLARP